MLDQNPALPMRGHVVSQATAAAARKAFLRRIAGMALLFALALAGVFRSHLGTALDSFTVDEPWHIVAGVSYLRSGDFRLNPEHPPVVKLWAGAAMPDSFHIRPARALSEKSQERDLVEETMFFDNDAASAQQRARVAMWTFHAILMTTLGVLLWRAFGLAWAAGTLAFLAIEPSVGAHLPVVMTDLPLAITLTIAAVVAGIAVTEWRWRWIVALGVAIGLALGSKHSALAGVTGIACGLIVAALVGRGDGAWRIVAIRAGKLAVAAVVSVGVVWALYGFHFHTGTDGTDAFNRTMPDKVADLQIARWREGVGLADRLQILPRAYLWGLADTVRSGVEGRGQNDHRLWGIDYIGKPPWFTWPSIVAAKVPLALLALSLLGAIVLHRSTLTPAARWALWLVFGASFAHLLALMGSQGTYGGIRHALPIVFALAVLAGAVFADAWQRRSRVTGVVGLALIAIAVAMTIREPRLWEYHNELAGGSSNAYRYFENEGVDLGQRFAEIRRFYDETIAPTGLPLYSDYWFGEIQGRAALPNYRRRVETLEDTNVAGIFDGFFLYPMHRTLPAPNWDWNPDEVFRGLTQVARFGNVGIWNGRQVRPETRATAMYWTIIDYIYKKGGSDWSLVAKRAAEVVALRPQHVGATIELGNAWLRLREPQAAANAYRDLLAQRKMPLDALTQRAIEEELALIDAGTDASAIPMLRNPWME